MVDDISAVSTKRPDLDLRLHSQESPAGEVCTLVQWVTVFQVEHSDKDDIVSCLPPPTTRLHDAVAL